MRSEYELVSTARTNETNKRHGININANDSLEPMMTGPLDELEAVKAYLEGYKYPGKLSVRKIK